MSRWRRSFHHIAGGFMCLIFTGFVVMTITFAFRAVRYPASPGLLIASFLFGGMAIGGITSTLWFQRRTIADFSYDGLTLQFQTLWISQIRMQPLANLSNIRDWQGRGGPLGYVLLLRDKRKLYLEYSVSNASTLASQIQADLQRLSPPPGVR